MSLHLTEEVNNNHSLEYSTICIIKRSKLKINFQQKKQSPTKKNSVQEQCCKRSNKEVQTVI